MSIAKNVKSQIKTMKTYGYIPKRKQKGQRCKCTCHSSGDSKPFWWNGAKYRSIDEVLECRVCNFKKKKHGKKLTDIEALQALDDAPG